MPLSFLLAIHNREITLKETKSFQKNLEEKKKDKLKHNYVLT